MVWTSTVSVSVGGLATPTRWSSDRLPVIEPFNAAVNTHEGDEFPSLQELQAPENLPALDHVLWGTALPQIAGELMSNLILRHSLPNANHRTGIARRQFCKTSESG